MECLSGVKQLSLSFEVRQALGMLQVRVSDLVQQMNSVIRLLVEENEKLQTQIKQQTN